MMTYRRITLGAVISMVLVGCNSEPNKPAPITSINGSSGTYSSSTASSGGSAGTSTQNTTAMDTSRPNISGDSSAASTSAAPVGENPFQGRPVANAASGNGTTTSGDRIAYNRRYSDIPKGSYNGGPTYTVSRGDTLFYIAWITGNDYRELAQRNNVAEPYALNVGQTLNVGNGANNSTVIAGSQSTSSSSNATQNQASSVDSGNSGAYTDPTSKQNVDKTLPSSQQSTGSTASTTTGTATAGAATSSVSGVRWRWPTEGKVVDNFSTAEGGNKGIDISGSRGQSILAAADGRIVYAGNALRGYGNLIIIKHNDDYLSAYAHNDSMLVAEQQEVKAGQKIATMGSTGTTSVRLHFEIRYKGKSVNPLQHLPQR
ncbi:Murein hydrolase activator NlpD precursor [Leminorella richardii]|uniref:Murein hydrolase activator NlpD n=2 Tax=Leminorella richardii TaxID=158841 RepID=A0A2X4UFC5_9GAMM|nr:Murein hydrolase activator NlpD precursor [Leminorella richardii]